jgi:hypothetical protein
MTVENELEKMVSKVNALIFMRPNSALKLIMYKWTEDIRREPGAVISFFTVNFCKIYCTCFML